MKAQISAGLNFALSGIPYWTLDIGGFCVEHRYENAQEGSEDLEEWRELNNRWFQFGTFLPLFRVHGQYPYREVFHLAPESHPAYPSMVYYNRLIYRMMPYIYSQAAKVCFEDYTLMRALVMDFPNDDRVTDVSDQYMFGPDIQYVAEKPNAPITLYVYDGSDAVFTLYEDGGLDYEYENGAFSSIGFSFKSESRTLTIRKRIGEYEGMTKERIFNVVFVTGRHPKPFDSATKPDHSVFYTGEEWEMIL